MALLAGLTLTFTRAADVRWAALAAQGFALLGTLIGITLVLTVGPTKTFDVTVHAVMLATLLTCLALTYRAPGTRNAPAWREVSGPVRASGILRKTFRSAVRRKYAWI